MAILLPLIEGKAPCFPHHREGGGASSEKLGCELCLATLGGGATFHEAAADKKVQGNGCLKASFSLGISSGFSVTVKKIETVAWERWE